MTNPPTTPLTALERELLASVERLVTACESSAKELHALEKRSTNGIEAQVIGLFKCVTELLKSHLLCVATLADLLTEEQNYATLEEQLRMSLSLARAAEKRLNGR